MTVDMRRWRQAHEMVEDAIVSGVFTSVAVSSISEATGVPRADVLAMGEAVKAGTLHMPPGTAEETGKSKTAQKPRKTAQKPRETAAPPAPAPEPEPTPTRHIPADLIDADAAGDNAMLAAAAQTVLTALHTWQACRDHTQQQAKRLDSIISHARALAGQVHP